MKNTFSADGIYYDADGSALKRSTLKKFLQIAMQPVGSTMYVWGGGWNEEDNGSGPDSVTIGISSRWREFFLQQDTSYDQKNTRFQIHDGLDCSGFVGWVVYNAFHTESGHSGYVTNARKMASLFAMKGWGSFNAAGTFSDYRPGDVMSSPDHVYLVVGQCSDTSIVLVHSSPQGVRLCGTCTRGGAMASQAVSLAGDYMRRYFPEWYSRYPQSDRGMPYLTQYARMRWFLTGNHMMEDPDHYAEKNAGEILADLFAPSTDHR